NGVDFAIMGRFKSGAQLMGGVSLGQTVIDNCLVVDSPQQARPGYCRVTLPWWTGQGQVKFSAVYPLPWWGVQTSAVYQNLAGAPVAANYVATNAQIAPSLGRSLASGANGTATIALLPPNTQFEDRLSELDVRFTKIIRVGRTRLQGSFDMYN